MLRGNLFVFFLLPFSHIRFSETAWPSPFCFLGNYFSEVFCHYLPHRAERKSKVNHLISCLRQFLVQCFNYYTTLAYLLKYITVHCVLPINIIRNYVLHIFVYSLQLKSIDEEVTVVEFESPGSFWNCLDMSKAFVASKDFIGSY